jgi:hypothetical protein
MLLEEVLELLQAEPEMPQSQHGHLLEMPR